VRPNDKRILKMANLGLLFPLIFYACVGFFGYSVYMNNTDSDFLKSFKSDYIGQPFYIATYIAIILAVVMTYPIYFFEARNMRLYFIDIVIGRKEIFSE
jgi:amino acid permease